MEVYCSRHLPSQSQESMEHGGGGGGIWDCDEDDVFYEELRRQVLLLTAEDDEECVENKPTIAAKSLQQRFSIGLGPPASTLPPGCYYHWSGNQAMDSVPRWLSNVWNSGIGTGVFIPQIIKSRRRYKPSRSFSYQAFLCSSLSSEFVVFTSC